ncbi:hypothetical protein [Shimazuella kribbensis]|uniref:hypothetical protein n=1 Tax=Shimazuella kribbensis TaxID=139808 RepID=UPI00042451EA|nr:hypothetical protein [Shimazuella kribbensis]
MSDNDNLKQIMRLLLEEIQGVKESIKHLPTREELLAVQQTAVTVEDKSETGYVLLNSQHARLENKLNEISSKMVDRTEFNEHTTMVTEGFQTTADTLQEIYILNKSLADKVNDLDDDVKDLQRKIG